MSTIVFISKKLSNICKQISVCAGLDMVKKCAYMTEKWFVRLKDLIQKVKFQKKLNNSNPKTAEATTKVLLSLHKIYYRGTIKKLRISISKVLSYILFISSLDDYLNRI